MYPFVDSSDHSVEALGHSAPGVAGQLQIRPIPSIGGVPVSAVHWGVS